MSKKLERKIDEIEEWLDNHDNVLDEDNYSVLFVANNTRTNAMHYSMTGEPVGLINNLVDLFYMITDYMGYESPEQLSEVVMKLLKIKRNIMCNGLSPELCEPQIASVCEGIYEQWLKHMNEFGEDGIDLDIEDKDDLEEDED